MVRGGIVSKSTPALRLAKDVLTGRAGLTPNWPEVMFIRDLPGSVPALAGRGEALFRGNRLIELTAFSLNF